MNVEISSVAAERIAEVRQWWRRNRPAASDVFSDELDALISRFAQMTPRSRLGTLYATTGDGQLWRFRLPASQQNVFYTVDEERQLVQIRTIWGAQRGPLTEL